MSQYYQGRPGIDALNLSTLPPNGEEALPELRGRISTRLAALDSEIADLASTFGGQQYMNAGIANYTILRGKIVEQATLQIFDQDLSGVQAAHEEEKGRVSGARDAALHSLMPLPSSADSATIEEQLASVRTQENILIANLGVLAVGVQTEQDLGASAKFQATASEASAAAQEIQTVSGSTRTTLITLQAQEARLQDILSHPLDHTQWTALSGVDFSVGSIAGSFTGFSPSPDNKTVVTAKNATNVIEVRDAISGSVKSSFSTESSLLSVASSADGKIWTLERAYFYRYIRLIDPQTDQKLWEWQTDTTITDLTASTDGNLLAVVANHTVSILRRNGDSVTRQDIVLTDNIASDIHFSPDGTFLALPMESALVMLNISTGTSYEFTGFRDNVHTTAWSSDGTMVAAGDGKGFVQIIDVPTKQKIGSFQMPFEIYVGALAFSPNQALLMTGDPNVGLMFWDITHLDQIHEYARSAGQKALSLFQQSSTGNTLLARNESGIIAYAMPDAGRGSPISRTSPPVLDPVPPTPPASPDHPAWPQSDKVAGTLGTLRSTNRFSSITSDGQSFVIPNGGEVQLESIATGQVTRHFTIGGLVRFAAFGSSDTELITVADDPMGRSTLTARDTSTGLVNVNRMLSNSWMGSAIDTAHNLIVIAEVSFPSRVKVFDLAQDISEEIPGTEDHSAALAFSESGRYVAVGLNDGTVVIYDRTTKQSHTLTGLQHEIKALAWSHGTDALLAAADDNAHLAIFSPTSAQALSVFSAPYDSDPTTSLLFSQNDLLLFRWRRWDSRDSRR